MGAKTCPAGDFCHFDASNQQRIGYQGAMTAPRNSLSAHDCGSALTCKPDKGIQRFLELRSLHVIRITAKAGVTPSSIDRVTASVSQSAQLRHMRI